MKYLFKNLILRDGVVPATARSHQGEKYSWVTAELFNEADPFGNPSRLPRYYIMEPNIVEMFRKYCEPVTGEANTFKVNEASITEAIAKGTCLDIMHIGNVFQVEVPLNEQYLRLDNENKPVVNKNGVSIPIQTLVLYLKKTFDPDTNEWTWVENPNTVATRILNRSYIPYANAANTPSVATAPQAEPEAPATETPEQKKVRLQAEINALGLHSRGIVA